MPPEKLQSDESVDDVPRPLASAAPHAHQLHVNPLGVKSAIVQPQSVAVVAPPKKKIHFFIIIATLLATMFLVAFTVTFYRLYFTDQVVDTDLVAGGTGHTAYMYPRHWEKHIINSDSLGYGASPRSDGTFKTFFGVSEKNSGPKGIMTQQKSLQQEAREQASNLLDDEAIQKTFTNDRCTSISNVQKTLGSRATQSALELVRLQSICHETDGDYVAVYSIILGDDGYFRYAAIITPQQTWDDNQVLFTRLIDSIDQSANSSAI